MIQVCVSSSEELAVRARAPVRDRGRSWLPPGPKLRDDLRLLVTRERGFGCRKDQSLFARQVTLELALQMGGPRANELALRFIAWVLSNRCKRVEKLPQHWLVLRVLRAHRRQHRFELWKPAPQPGQQTFLLVGDMQRQRLPEVALAVASPMYFNAFRSKFPTRLRYTPALHARSTGGTVSIRKSMWSCSASLATA